MKKCILFLLSGLFIFACASAPVKEEDVESAKGEARTIHNKFGTACLSLGWPEGSTPYINCVIDFYVKENADALERRQVLTEALKRRIRSQQ